MPGRRSSGRLSFAHHERGVVEGNGSKGGGWLGDAGLFILVVFRAEGIVDNFRG